MHDTFKFVLPGSFVLYTINIIDFVSPQRLTHKTLGNYCVSSDTTLAAN